MFLIEVTEFLVTPTSFAIWESLSILCCLINHKAESGLSCLLDRGMYFLAFFSVLLVGLGSGIYLVANLGPGPRDGLMTGLTKLTNLPIALVRAFLEISAVLAGWYLGGTVGAGTLIFAFGIGPCVALGLFLVNRLFN